MEVAQALADLLNSIEQKCAWPIQVLINIIVLMGKPQGGVRPIALMPMIYRIWTKIRKPLLVEWEYENRGPWDAAVRGSSALRAAILSAFHDEIAHYNDEYLTKILWDMEKFYDNINSICDKMIKIIWRA